MLVFYAMHPADLVARGATSRSSRRETGRISSVSYHVDTTAQILVEQVKRTFLTFHLFGDSSSEFAFRGPMVDALTAALLLVGLGLALPACAVPCTLAFVAWVGGVLVVGGVLTLDPPDWVHLVVTLPAVAVLAALGVDACAGASQGGGRARRWLPTAVAAVVVAAIRGARLERLTWNAVRDNAGLYCAVARWVASLPSDTRGS